MNFSDRRTVLEHFRAEMSPNVWYGHISSIFFVYHLMNTINGI